MAIQEPTHDLHTFIAQQTAEMASEYLRIRARAQEDPGTAGDEGEANWAQLFKEWLPSTYHVETKGRLIGADGSMSPQADIVILRPDYPRKMLEKKKWLAGGVVAVFECKNTLTSAHIEESVERCIKFKSIYPERTGSPYKEFKSPLIYGLIAHSHNWKGENSNPIDNIERALFSSQNKVSHPRFEIDSICVSDLASWRAMYMCPFDQFPPRTGFVCTRPDYEQQVRNFNPIGSLINNVMEMLAWEDASLRPMAEYYTGSHLGGAGMAKLKEWPKSVLSPKVQTGMQIRLVNGEPWNEWSLGW